MMAILYSIEHPQDLCHKYAKVGPHGPYVRVEYVGGQSPGEGTPSPSDALDLAEPLPGETVLNAVKVLRGGDAESPTFSGPEHPSSHPDRPEYPRPNG